MALDLELCRYYIGRDLAFWQEVQDCLSAALKIPDADTLFSGIEDALLRRHQAAEGAQLLTRFAQLTEEAGPLAPLGVLASFLPRALIPYRHQGADDKILKDTFGDVLRWVDWYKREHGVDGLSELSWAVLPYTTAIYQIGCLQYQLRENHFPVQVWKVGGSLLLFACGGVYVDRHGRACAHAENASFITGWKQKDGMLTGHLIDPVTGLIDHDATTLPEEGMTRLLKPGALSLALHIPAGTSLDPAEVDQSLRAARDFFAQAGTPFPVCLCHSWMLDPQNTRFLPPTSRILNLANRFARFTVAGEGSGARFIFSTDTPYQKIPESAVETSLQKAVMRHLKAGGKLYDFGGAMLL